MNNGWKPVISELVENKKERALLVGLTLKGQDSSVTDDHLTELSLLTETAGAEIVHIITQKRERIDFTYYVGKGKCAEIKNFALELEADLIVFDDDLSPAQMRNLEREIDKRIVDRTGIILDIFARRALTREAKIEVELAQLNYLLPRLTRHWKHLSRQIGGIGVRGPGETQLETDRRLVRERISALRKKLDKIESGRATRRKKRSRIPVVALVGYTNAGKSTLLNSITDAGVFVEDKLFATLDPVVRSFEDDHGRKILFTDTVGFIRKLPHHLIASFKSTLEEVVEADLVLHVVDVSHPFYLEQMEGVREILRDIGAGDRPSMTIFNKVDLVSRDSAISIAKDRYPDAHFISALRCIGIAAMLTEAMNRLFEPQLTCIIEIEPERMADWGKNFSEVKIDSSEFIRDKVKLKITVKESMKDALFEFAGTGNIKFTED